MAQAVGLLVVVRSIRFRLAASIMETVLGMLAPVDRLLQTRESDLQHGISLITTTFDEIKRLRNDNSFQSCMAKAESEQTISETFFRIMLLGFYILLL